MNFNCFIHGNNDDDDDKKERIVSRCMSLNDY